MSSSDVSVRSSILPLPNFNQIKEKCEVVFLFNLINSEAVHFFSKFIVRDDDSLVQNMHKLYDLAS